MSNFNTNLQTNNTNLQSILDAINALPEAGSGDIELPSLTNEGTSADLLASKELIDQDGNIITGTMPNNGAISKTMDGIDVKTISIPAGYTSGGSVSLDSTIDDEVDEQTDLISQITTALEGKAAGGGNKEIKLQNKQAIPSRNLQHITADSGYDGLALVTIEGSADLIPPNIISGKAIFGVVGTAEVGGSGSREMTDFIEGHLTEIYSEANYVTDNVFCHNSILERAALPYATHIGSHAFRGCEFLKVVDLSAVGHFSGGAFIDCESLVALIIRNTEIVPVLEYDALGGTPIIDGMGYIYVPRNMISAYSANDEWSVYEEQFRPLEDYTSDGTITGEFILPNDAILVTLPVFDWEGSFLDYVLTVSSDTTWSDWFSENNEDGMFTFGPNAEIIFNEAYYVIDAIEGRLVGFDETIYRQYEAITVITFDQYDKMFGGGE